MKTQYIVCDSSFIKMMAEVDSFWRKVMNPRLTDIWPNLGKK